MTVASSARDLPAVVFFSAAVEATVVASFAAVVTSVVTSSS